MDDARGVSRGYQFDAGEPLAPWWWCTVARVRGIATTGGYLGIIASTLGRLLGVISDDVALDLLYPCCFLLALGVALTGSAVSTPRIAARTLGWPIRGRWVTVNSPARRVPSHRTHGYGQTFAIDLVYDPGGDSPSGTRERAFRRPDEFGGFGQEILAPATGRVVIVRDGARDHRSRSTRNAISFMALEGVVRQLLGGSRLLLGNVIVLDLGHGVYVALAHLERRSATVRPGQQVSEGEVVGRCGNSGNSSQPHLHLQLMDHARPWLAAGLPFTFTGISDDASPRHGRVPREGEAVKATPHDAARPDDRWCASRRGCATGTPDEWARAD